MVSALPTEPHNTCTVNHQGSRVLRNVGGASEALTLGDDGEASPPVLRMHRYRSVWGGWRSRVNPGSYYHTYIHGWHMRTLGISTVWVYFSERGVGGWEQV